MALDAHIFDRLPAKARARLGALRQARDEALGLANWGSEKRRKAYAELERIETQEARLRGWPGAANTIDDNDSRLEALAAERERAEAIVNAAVEKLEEYEAAANHLGRLFTAAERWLASLPADAVLEDATAKPVGTLEKAQAASDKIRSEIHDLASAPIPAAEAKAIARQTIEDMAAAGRPMVARTIEAGLRPSWGKVPPLYDMLPAGADGAASLPLSVLAWALGDTLVSAVEKEIDLQADDVRAVPMVDREVQIGRLRDRLLDAEVNEVATHHEVYGLEDWSFRQELDIRAVLLVRMEGR